MTVPPGGPPRAVIDSSVLVPILIYQCPSANWLVGLWKSQRIILLARQDTLEELSAKLKEKAPTTREYPAQRFAPAALRQYAPWCETIPPKDNTGLPECSDEKDQKFIDPAFAGLAFAGKADFLITRDHALLAMEPQTPFSILDDAAFRRLGT